MHAEDENPVSGGRSRSWKRIAGWVVIGGCALAVLIQAVPYGRDHTNPPIKTKPAWTSVKVEQLATAACADCHSNATRWPWYTNVAPISWLVQKDVDEGRSKLNWSEGCAEAGEVRDVIKEGEMPPLQYTIKHADARLSKSDRRVLGAGLAASIANASGTWRSCGD